jgi:DeoR/GlpR family transcriptional regulator of sugar metabolism
MRQSGNAAILDRIRQSGNCRLRDILEMLPDYSERTIRCDLQTLVEQGSMERIGADGPSVYYRIRQAAQAA